VKNLKSSWIESPIGRLFAIATDSKLVLLEFFDARGIAREIEKCSQYFKSEIIPGENKILTTIQNEIKSYFAGTLQKFKTPIEFMGTSFQQKVWNALLTIPYGQTRSYKAQSELLQNPTATRAVANANGANQLAIIIPCHRVIQSNDDLGGYGGGIARKQWLLDHEKNHQG
jgi:AraC family transcriptional regulator of adaptative response/methylated-DNA-[protein]-cysteine methyltransferase